MGWYDRVILPKLVHCACGSRPVTRQRQKLVPEATGRVLEIGVGTGLNLPFYNTEQVDYVMALDPSRESWELAQRTLPPLSLDVRYLEAGAERIPLDDHCIDTIVMTYSLCTIPEIPASLQEMRRVLAPGGTLLFCEHGRAPDARVYNWQRRINPLWKRIGGGCHLDRDIPTLLTTNGFQLDDLQQMYLPGWKFASYNYWGAASSR